MENVLPDSREYKAFQMYMETPSLRRSPEEMLQLKQMWEFRDPGSQA